MFGDKLVWDSHSTRYAEKIFREMPEDLFLKKTIISVGGISGTRKSETAFCLADLLIKRGKEAHIISSDDYYKTRWNDRSAVRIKTNLKDVGPEELDWQRLLWTFETFKNPLYQQMHFFQMSKYSTAIIQAFIDKARCDILIFEGLYACDPRIDADLKVHLGPCDPQETFDFRQQRGKENEVSDLRRQIVEKECAAVKRLKKHADLVLLPEKPESGEPPAD
ncbi:MAG: hypothetical protein ABIJ96_14805 [Elusimicrobiota bacterium]